MHYKYPVVLTIAGSDCSGGAGIQADLKTITVLKCYGASVITALTAQNTRGVQGIFPVPEDFIGKQLDSVFSDLKVDAVKIGMLHNAKAVEVVAKKLREYNAVNIVLDPVMASTSGDLLLENDAVAALKEKLFPLSYLLTPNVRETEILTGIKITSEKDFNDAALKFKELNFRNVLLKSGDLKNNEANDLLLINGKNNYELEWFKGEKIDSLNTHGTGCTLSSAIASYLAFGNSLKDSIRKAKDFLTGAIISAKDEKLGRGKGPVDHLYKI
jgi:hydroxymethylpyrimidine/phosphomethylpyrimidine kinase